MVECSVMKIGNSELILKKDRVYHLGLSPEELADIVITVGDPARVKMVSKHFDSIDAVVQKREFVTHTGSIGDKRISVIGTGIGPDNIDILMNEIDAIKNIDLEKREIKESSTRLIIIRLGTSGTIQKDIEVDTYVASSFGFGLDGLMNFYEYEPDEMQIAFLSKIRDHVPELFDICNPSFFEADSDLMHLIGKDLKQVH